MAILQVKKRFSNLLFPAFFLVLFISTPTLAWAEETAANLDNTNRFYGNQSLNSLVDGDNMIVSLPGGARVEIEDSEVAYVVTDHLHSARVAVNEDDNTSLEQTTYTPFGDTGDRTETNVRRSYTGMNFEPEIATYDYHARRYDPSAGRFTSLDAARQSISPYSYAKNNPINFIDPTGLVPMYVLFYFGEGAEVEAISQIKFFKEVFSSFSGSGNVAIDLSSRPTEQPNGATALSSRPTEQFYKSLLMMGEVKHLIINVGSPEALTWAMPGEESGGAAFAKKIQSKLKLQELDVGQGSEFNHVNSILLQGCGLTCSPHQGQPRSELGPAYDSWAAGFALEAKKKFPNLKKVRASPYRLSAVIDSDSPSFTNISISQLEDVELKHQFKISVDTKEYYNGSSKELIKPPASDMVYDIISPDFPVIENERGFAKMLRQEEFLSSHGFTKSILYEFPLQTINRVPSTLYSSFSQHAVSN